MAKRLVNVDDELLAAARRELGTAGVTDTVRTALRRAADAGARARQIEWLRRGSLEPLADKSDRAAVWR